MNSMFCRTPFVLTCLFQCIVEFLTSFSPSPLELLCDRWSREGGGRASPSSRGWHIMVEGLQSIFVWLERSSIIVGPCGVRGKDIVSRVPHGMAAPTFWWESVAVILQQRRYWSPFSCLERRLLLQHLKEIKMVGDVDALLCSRFEKEMSWWG